MRLPLRLPAGARGTAAAALTYLVLAVVWAAPSSLSPSDTVPDLGDPLHLAYVMAWDAHQLVRKPWALFESNSFYPYARSLAFGDHLLPEAVMVAPINWATGNAVLASNVGVVLALGLSALTMFLLVRHLTGSWGAALLSGLMYAFNSFTRHELLRVHVLNLEWWPLALLFLDRFVRGGGRARDAAWLAATLVLQTLSGAYYLVCTALLGPAWLVTAYAAARRAPSLGEARILARAALLAAAPAALVLWPYVPQLRSMGFEKSLVDGADLVCYLQPPAEGWLWGSVGVYSGCFGLPHFIGFVGACAMALGAWTLLRRRDKARGIGIVAIVTAVGGLGLSLGPMMRAGGHALGPGPFRALHALVPLVRGMDGSKRMGVLVILGGSILAGIAFAALLERTPRALRPAVLVPLGVLLPLEHWTPAEPAPSVPTGASVPAVYPWLAEGPLEPMVELPLYADVTKRYWAAYLFFSTAHWRPIPIGRTSFYPPAHDFLVWSLRGFPDETALVLLDRLGIRTIVVHPLAWDPSERTERLSALDAEPRLALVRRFDDTPPARFAELGLGQERVYRLVAAASRAAPPCTPTGEIPREGWALRSVVHGRHAAPTAPHPRATRFVEWVREREWRTPWVAEWARDGDRRTTWTTAGSQNAGDGLEVRLPRDEIVSAVTLDLAYPYDEFGRDLVLVAEGSGDERRRLRWADGPEERWATLEDLLLRPREARMVLRLHPQALRQLTVKVGGREEDAAWPRWSVPELRLFRECR